MRLEIDNIASTTSTYSRPAKKRKIFSFSLGDTWKNKVKCMSIFQILPLPVFERKNINNLNVKVSQGLSEVSSMFCISYTDQFFLQKEISRISARLKHKYHRDKNVHNLFRFYSRVWTWGLHSRIWIQLLVKICISSAVSTVDVFKHSGNISCKTWARI